MEKRPDKPNSFALQQLIAGICFVLAVFCVIYFIVIIFYSGLLTAYCPVWLFMAAVFVIMRRFIIRSIKTEGGMPKFLPTFVFTSFAMFSLVFILVLSMVLKESKTDNMNEDTDYVVVMGARVYPDGISRTLLYRLDKALNYYSEHPNTTLVLSGGLGSEDAVPEALAMFNYLSMNGVPSSRMIINAEGTSTYETILKAYEEIMIDTAYRKIPKGPGDKVWDSDYVPSVGIITSDYHMMRSVKILENAGIEKPVALPARSDRVLFLHQCVRESAAIVKDFLMGNFTLNERDISLIKNG